MNPEERLSDALHATFDAAQPSPDLADRIVQRASVSRRRTIWFNVRLAVAGIVGVAVLWVVLVLAPVAFNSRGTGGGPGATPGGLAHFDRDGLAFDYPASWKTSVSGLNMHYVTILDFLGTGSGLASCTAITPGPNDKFISGTECGAHLTVGAGQVVVEVSLQEGPPGLGLIDPSDPSGIDSGGKYVTVGGLPAIFSDSGTTLDWTLSVPGQLMSRYRIHVEMKDPGAEQMRAQVEALVASLGYSPAVAVLDPADGPRIAAIGLAKARASEPDYACFPSVPGATATATVQEFAGYSSMRKPLPVTCSMDIAPSAVGLWKMTLTESWTAASDRSAGSLTTTIWLDPDGTPGMTQGGPGPSEMPYWP